MDRRYFPLLFLRLLDSKPNLEFEKVVYECRHSGGVRQTRPALLGGNGFRESLGAG